MKRTVRSVFPRFFRAQSLHERRGNRRALMYAALLHLILCAFLLYGIRWKHRPASLSAEAELWRTADITPPSNRPSPASKPVSKPVVPAPKPTQSAPPSPSPESAEIALKNARRRQEQNALERMQQQAKQRRRHQEAQARQRQLAEQEKANREQKLRAQLEERQRAEQRQQAQQRIEQQEALQAQQRAAQQAKEKAYVEQQRRARLETLTHAAARANTPGMAGSAQSGTGMQGVSSSYADRVRQRVKPNLIFDPQSLNGNPQTVVSVQCAPDGTLLNTSIMRSSGYATWDAAVLRAVQKSNPMPRDVNGQTPGYFTITFRPKD